MAKRSKKQDSVVTERAEETLDVSSQAELQQDASKQEPTKPVFEETAQSVESEQDFVEQSASSADRNLDEGENVAEKRETTAEEQAPLAVQAETEETTEVVKKAEKQKSGGTAIALLALLIALGVGGAGYFFVQQKFVASEQRVAELQQQVKTLATQGVTVNSSQSAVEMPTFEAEKAQIAKLETAQQQSLSELGQLASQQEQSVKQSAQQAEQIARLQAQLQQLGAMPKAEPTAWLLSDADFLLTNALRKIVIDYDIETAKSLLLEADNALSQVNDTQIVAVREALKADLNNLASLNQVDQNNVMQRLAQLANTIDDMPMLDNDQLAMKENGEVSDSIDDWQKNLEKNADSFLSHFIRVSDKKQVQDKAFIAPNQEIYLRENIRLRLQIAILAVPRQQNELYKQSLEAVSTWVRSYFDVQSETVKQFLKEIDELVEQSIYIDAPTKLQSLELLKQKLNRRLPTVEKMGLEVGKEVEKLKIDPPVETVPAVKPSDAPAQPEPQPVQQ